MFCLFFPRGGRACWCCFIVGLFAGVVVVFGGGCFCFGFGGGCFCFGLGGGCFCLFVCCCLVVVVFCCCFFVKRSEFEYTRE